MKKTYNARIPIWVLLSLVSGLCVDNSEAVTLGQVDDFENGTVQGWGEGGGSPNPPTNVLGGPPGSTRYLQDVSSGTGAAGGKMTFFNASQWTGDFIAAGITEIRAMVRVDPLSAGPLNLRVGFRSAAEFGQQGHVSLVSVAVADDGLWHEVVFPIESADLVPVGFTFENYSQTMSNVGQMRFLNSANVDWQGQNFQATMGIDNITAGPVSTDTNYTGWLWETSVYSNGFSVQEDNCFGPFNVVLSEDQTWTASGTDEVCRGRDTQSNSRNFMNPLPSDFEAQSTQPMVSAGGNLYELYGEDVVGGIGEGEARLATALFEPSDGRLLFLSGHESTDEPGNLESFGFLHLLAKTTPSIVTARTAADLEGTSWRVASAVHARNDGSVNGETASSTVLTVDFEAGGVCTYSPSTVFPDFVKNRDVYVATQFSNGGNLDNRAVQAGVSGAEFSDCSYAIDGEGYLAIDVTLTVDTNPLNPIAVALRYTVSDDEQYLVAAPAAAGPTSGFRGLAAGFRAANALPANSIDGNYLFYLMLSEFGATGSFHSGGEFGRQEFDFRGRGLFSFDSSVPGTVPDGETGTWFECSATMVQNGFELGYSGDYSVGTASPDAEVSAEDLTFTGCDYRLGADGGLSVHVVVTVPGDPAPFEATLHGYVNSNGEVFALALGTSEPPPSALTEDFGSVFFVLGMEYTGDSNGNEDSDDLSNLEEFQFPLVPQPFTAIIGLPDLNGNGSSDVGVVMPGSGHVHIRDGSTDALLRDIDYGADEVFDVVVLSDLNSSGKPEIALLTEQASGQVRVQIRDSFTGGLVKYLWYGLQYEPVSMAVVPDYNGGGFPEVAVLGSQAGTDAIRVQVRDAATDTFLDNVFLGTQGIANDLVALADTSGNGIPEMGILSVLKDSDHARIQVWDTDTAALQTYIWFGKVYQPQTTITMPDINSNGADEVVAMGVDPATQDIRVQVRDSDSAATLFNIYLGNVNQAVDIALINDINGNGFQDLAVLLETPAGVGRVRVQDGSTGAFIRNLFFSVVENPAGLAVLPDYSGNGFDELAALGESAGVRHVQILDTSTASQVNRINFP